MLAFRSIKTVLELTLPDIFDISDAPARGSLPMASSRRRIDPQYVEGGRVFPLLFTGEPTTPSAAKSPANFSDEAE